SQVRTHARRRKQQPFRVEHDCHSGLDAAGVWRIVIAVDRPVIVRDLARAARTVYDVVIIGGGVYGAMLSLESSLRGLTSALIEKADFGGETSFNSLKTIHGGLRHLQRADLVRHREFVRERLWYFKTFPD